MGRVFCLNGTVFNIQRFSIHDGPGIRTTVFLKGCNLSCWWCHNPEGKSASTQIQFYPEKCIGCGNCARTCTNGCFDAGTYQRENCVGCGRCAEGCPSNALVKCGEIWTGEQVLEEVMRDRPFYAAEGGVTFSGGECMLQHTFLSETLSLCKRNSIHTAIETAADVPYEYFEEVLPYLDLAIVDIKCISEKRHIKNVGVSNKRILENINRLLTQQRVKVWIRVPIIPNFNLDRDELEATAEYIAGLKTVERVELMKYHPLGNSKLKSLGREEINDIVMTEEAFAEAVSVFHRKGVASLH